MDELVPPEILVLLGSGSYLSTACHTGSRVHAIPLALLPEKMPLALLEAEMDRLHKRCRLTHKFTGQFCRCSCHSSQPSGLHGM